LERRRLLERETRGELYQQHRQFLIQPRHILQEPGKLIRAAGQLCVVGDRSGNFHGETESGRNTAPPALVSLQAMRPIKRGVYFDGVEILRVLFQMTARERRCQPVSGGDRPPCDADASRVRAGRCMGQNCHNMSVPSYRTSVCRLMLPLGVRPMTTGNRCSPTLGMAQSPWLPARTCQNIVLDSSNSRVVMEPCVSSDKAAANGSSKSTNGPSSEKRSSDGEKRSSDKGSSDEAIGRPQEWREGRYQQPGKPVDSSVVTPANGEKGRPDTISTPVTRKDYEQGAAPLAPKHYEQGNGSLADRALAQWNIGTGRDRSSGRFERSL
jgi:hypothetical protein